ncbi:hypothetical protein [Parablautia muri]|uniref:hypothetical protein n=1 Tax=Parablautia muri TaxID=2320879 RepID=UPI001371A69C|nr:hypothetical protein [Parablautia muri]
MDSVLICHPYVFFERVWKEVLFADESRERVSWLSWADKMLLIYGGKEVILWSE